MLLGGYQPQGRGTRKAVPYALILAPTRELTSQVGTAVWGVWCVKLEQRCGAGGLECGMCAGGAVWGRGGWDVGCVKKARERRCGGSNCSTVSYSK